MNFMTQLGEGHHAYNSPISYLKPDPYHYGSNFLHPSHSPYLARRHNNNNSLLLPSVEDKDASRRRSRSRSMQSEAIDLNDLASNRRSPSTNLLNTQLGEHRSKSTLSSTSHTRSRSRVDVEDAEQLLKAEGASSRKTSTTTGIVFGASGDGEGEGELPPSIGTSQLSKYMTPACTEVLPPEHECQLEGCQRVVINVSGLRFETQIRTLERLPDTLLGNPEKRRQYWDESRQEFFFDRHRPTFQAVLYYYQSGGRLKRPLEVPLDIFLNELMFYELGGAAIDSFKQNEGYILEKPRPQGPRHPFMNRIWTTLEYPESSLIAKVFAGLSMLFIVTSVITFCAETLPSLKNTGCVNVTDLDPHTGLNVTSSFHNYLDPLFLTETGCMAWFVMELLLRFAVSPSKLLFFRAAVNWIDLLAIAPYFVFLGLSSVSGSCTTGHKSSILSVLRLLRVVRILKLSKHSEGLKILGMTLKTSVRELTMFLLFLAIATVIFSGAIFYAELDLPESQFTSIPDAFWWAIVSMTTVGYGDYVPKGLPGKLMGSLCVLAGVLAIALPVPVIVANFNNYYRHYAESRLSRRKLPRVFLRLHHLVTCRECNRY